MSEMDLSAMTASGGTLKINGRTLLVRPLTMGDYGRVRAWVKEKLPRPFAIAAQAILDLEPLRLAKPELYEMTKDNILLAAAEDAKQDIVAANDQKVNDLLNSPEGIAFMLWLSVRKDHPDVTLEWIEDSIAEMSVEDIKRKMDDINVNWIKEKNEFSDPQTPASQNQETK